MIYVVLPAYNEEENVSTLLGDIAATLAELMPVSEVRVVVVDDGSADRTSDLVNEVRPWLEQKFPRFHVELIVHPTNKGLAEAIKTGLLYCCDKAVSSDIVLTMDCDNSHTPGLIPQLSRRIFEGYDVVIASRYVAGARIFGLSWSRQILSLAASILFRACFPIAGIRDYTCGFRAYRASVLKDVFKENPNFITETGFTVMIDLLLKLHHTRPTLAFGEVPLLLRYDRKQGLSKMNVQKTARQSIGLLLRRRFGNWST